MLSFKNISTLLLASTSLIAAVPADLVKRADLKAFDISSAQSSSFWSCAKSNGYTKPVIRGYQQACGSVSLRIPSPMTKAGGLQMIREDESILVSSPPTKLRGQLASRTSTPTCFHVWQRILKLDCPDLRLS